MSRSFTLPDELASGLAAEAAKRSVTPDELAAQFIAARLPRTGAVAARHRLSFAGIGASTSRRRAAEDEAMLERRIELDADAFERFVAALDEPVEDMPNLRRYAEKSGPASSE